MRIAVLTRLDYHGKLRRYAKNSESVSAKKRRIMKFRGTSHAENDKMFGLLYHLEYLRAVLIV